MSTSTAASAGLASFLGLPIVEDPDQYEEDEDYTIREHLGLRPDDYSNANYTKGSHPDRRPCPPWCWVGRHPEYDHEILPDRPMTAHHTMDGVPSIVASRYPGKMCGTPDDRQVHTATIEPRLDQFGQEDPRIDIALRTYSANGEQHYENDQLLMSVADAKELVKVLALLIDAANQGA